MELDRLTKGYLLACSLLTPSAFAQQVAEATAAPAAPLDTIAVATPAESPAAEAEAAKPRNRLVEEVVVTAQKREEKLQDVPISIQAFSSEALAARGLETTAELGQAVPGLQFTGIAGFTLIFIRGIGTDNFIPSADPSVATYVDGIYLPAGQTTSQSLGNIQRVEVLKGPQGTLFGRNATGGAISIVTEEPGDVFKASGELERGNRFNTKSARLSASGPVTDWLAIGVSGLATRKESVYGADFFDPQDDKVNAGRVKINIHPTDYLSLSLTGFRSIQQGLGSLIGNNTEPSLIGTGAIVHPTEDDYTSSMDFEAEGRNRQDLFYGTLTWNTALADIKLIGSEQRTQQDFASTDFDGSAVPIAAFDTTNEFARLNTGELQILSNDETPGSDKFQWVTGVYYLRSRAGFDPAHLRVAPGGLDAALALGGIELPEGLRNLFTTLLPNTPLEETGISLALHGLMETKSYSAYAQGTYFFNDWLDLTLGGRYQSEKRYLIEASTGALIPGTEIEATVLPFTLPPSETAKKFSPKAVLSLHPREDAMVYASYSVGYKSGTFNIINIYTPPNYIVPEKVTTYELGAKVDFFGGLLRVNGAVFNNDIDNLQSGFVSVQSGGAVRFVTAGAARTRGVEMDVISMPIPDLNPGLAITGNIAYVDAKYTDFKNGSGFRPGTGLYAPNQDFSGNEIVRAPKTSGGAAIVQAIELDRGTIELAVDGYYNSGFFYDAFNTVEEKAYTLMNARVSYLHAPWKLRVTLFGKNILDERYHFQQFQTDFGVTKTLATPREMGVRLNWDF